MKNTMKTTLCLLMVLPLLIGSGCSSQKKAAAVKEAEKKEVTASSSSEQKTAADFKDEDLVELEFQNLTFQVPESWQETLKESADLWVLSPYENQIRISMQKDPGYLLNADCPASQYKSFIQDIEKQFTDVEMEQEEFETIGKLETLHLGFSGTYEGKDSWNEVTAFSDQDGQLYTFLLINPDSSSANSSQDFHELIKTIQLAKTETAKPEEEPKKEEKTPESDNTAIRPEVKEFLDEYENFMDSYIEFMTKYENSNGTDMTMLMDYANFMNDYASFAEKADKMEGDLTDAELIYYMEVINRCNEKLLKASL